MGVPDTKPVLRELQVRYLQQLKDAKSKGKGKGKGKQVESHEEDVRFIVEAANATEAVDFIITRITSEAVIKRVEEPRIKVFIDANSALHEANRAVTKLVQSDPRLDSADRRIIMERSQRFSQLDIVEFYRSILPAGTEIEISSDHQHERPLSKLLEEQNRLEPLALAFAEKLVALFIAAKNTPIGTHSTRSRKERRKKRLAGAVDESGDVTLVADELEDGGVAEMADETVVGDAGMGDDGELERKETSGWIENAAKEIIKQHYFEYPPSEVPSAKDFEHVDEVVRLFSIDIVSLATCVRASLENDEAIIARAQGSTQDDLRIDTTLAPLSLSTPLASSSTDVDMVETVHEPATENPSTKDDTPPVLIQVTNDTDPIFTRHVRFVISEDQRRGLKGRYEVVDLAALDKVPESLWPLRSVSASVAVMVMVSKESGGKVSGLGLRGALKNERILTFAHEIDLVRQALDTLNGSMEEEDSTQVDLPFLGDSFDSVEKLEGVFRKLFKKPPPWTLAEYLDNCFDRLNPPSSIADKLSKEEEVLRRSVAICEQRIKDYGRPVEGAIQGRNHRHHPSHSAALPSTLANSQAAVEAPPAHSPSGNLSSISLPSLGPIPSSSHSAASSSSAIGPSAEHSHSLPFIAPLLPNSPPHSKSNQASHPSPTLSPNSQRRRLPYAYSVTFDKHVNPLVKIQKDIETFQSSSFITTHAKAAAAARQGSTVASTSGEKKKEAVTIRGKEDDEEESKDQEGVAEDSNGGDKKGKGKAKDESEGKQPQPSRGTGYSGFGNPISCMGTFPLSPSLFNDVVFKIATHFEGKSMPTTDSEWEAASKEHSWPHEAVWIFRVILLVGRDSLYNMGVLLDGVYRGCASYEPGYLDAIDEDRRGGAYMAESMHALLSELGLSGLKPREPSQLATSEEIDHFLLGYNKARNDINRINWSSPSQRQTVKEVLLEIGIEVDELEIFLYKARANKKICLSMLVVAKTLQRTENSHPPIVDYVKFYSDNFATYSTNVIVSARNRSSRFIEDLTRTVLEDAATIDQRIGDLPLQISTGDELDDLGSQVTVGCRYLLETLSNNSSSTRSPYPSIRRIVQQALESIDTSDDAAPSVFLDIVSELEVQLKEVRIDAVRNLEWSPNSNELKNGVKESAHRLSLLITAVARSWQYVNKANLSRMEEESYHEGKAKLISLLKRLRSITTSKGWQSCSVEKVDGKKVDEKGKGKAKVTEEGEEEDELAGTFKGREGAAQFRTLVAAFNPFLKQSHVNYHPQSVRLDSELLQIFLRDPISTDKKDVESKTKQKKKEAKGTRPLVRWAKELTRRMCEGIDQLNLVDPALLHPPTSTQPPASSPTTPERQRGEVTAARFLRRIEGSRPERKVSADKSRSNRSPTLSSPTDSRDSTLDMYRPRLSGNGIPHYQLGRDLRVKLESENAPPEDLERILFDVHAIGLVQFKKSQTGRIYEIRVDESRFAKFDTACSNVNRIFVVPFEKDLVYSHRTPHISQLGSDFLRLIFAPDFGTRLPYDMLNISDKGVQLFFLNPRKYASNGFKQIDKLGIPRTIDWREVFAQLLSTRKKFEESIAAVDFSRIGIRKGPRTDSFTQRKKGETRRLQLDPVPKQHAKITAAELTFCRDETRGGVWWKNQRWIQGPKSGPPTFSDRTPLFFSTNSPSEKFGPDSKSVRSLQVAEGAAGRSTPAGTRHTFYGIDAGESYFNAGSVVVRGKEGSCFMKLRAQGVKLDAKLNGQVVAVLERSTTKHKILKSFVGIGTGSRSLGEGFRVIDFPASALSNTLSNLSTSSQPSTSSSPPIAHHHLTAQTSSWIPASLHCSLLSKKPEEYSIWNAKNEIRKRKMMQSAAAVAINQAVPRIRKAGDDSTSTSHEPFKTQSIGVILGRGNSKTGALGFGIGSIQVQASINAVKARPDLKEYPVLVSENYTSQCCIICRGPLVYLIGIDKNGNAYYIYRILRCPRCRKYFHRDKVGSTNMLASLLDLLDTNSNLLAPSFSSALGNGPRTTSRDPTLCLTDALEALERQNDGSYKTASVDEWEEMVKGLELKVVKKREIQAEKKKELEATAKKGKGKGKAKDDSLELEEEEEEEYVGVLLRGDGSEEEGGEVSDESDENGEVE